MDNVNEGDSVIYINILKEWMIKKMDDEKDNCWWRKMEWMWEKVNMMGNSVIMMMNGDKNEKERWRLVWIMKKF